MISDMIFPEVKKVSVTLAILDIVMIIISIIIGVFDFSIILGIILGNIYTILNFILLGNVVRDAVEKMANSATRHMKIHYTFRYIMTGAVLAVGFFVPYINGWCVAISLLAPKLTYTAIGIFTSLKDAKLNKKSKKELE